jgi:hypothetical protein
MNIDFETEMALLKTGYFPSPEQASNFQARIMQNTDTIHHLDEELADLAKKQDALESKRAQFVRSSQIAKAFLSPIRRIPVEIIQQILGYVIPELYRHILSSITGLEEEFERITFFHDLCQSRTALSLVCHVWWNIISNTPDFWSSLRLTATFDDKRNILCRCDFHSVKNGPVDAVVDDFGFDFNSSLTVASIIREQLSRIRILTIACAPSWKSGRPTIDYLGEIFPHNQQTVAPAVVILRLYAYYPYSDRGRRINVGKIHAPKLFKFRF